MLAEFLRLYTENKVFPDNNYIVAPIRVRDNFYYYILNIFFCLSDYQKYLNVFVLIFFINREFLLNFAENII
jgi:hypothetical protein